MTPLERQELEVIVRYLSSLGFKVLSLDLTTGLATVQLPLEKTMGAHQTFH